MRQSLSYGLEVNLWMLASGGQLEPWVLHPDFLTPEL